MNRPWFGWRRSIYSYLVLPTTSLQIHRRIGPSPRPAILRSIQIFWKKSLPTYQFYSLLLNHPLSFGFHCAAMGRRRSGLNAAFPGRVCALQRHNACNDSSSLVNKFFPIPVGRNYFSIKPGWSSGLELNSDLWSNDQADILNFFIHLGELSCPFFSN